MGNPSIHRIERLNYGISAVVVLIALLTQTRSITLGVAVGAGLTCLNFYVLRRLVTKWTKEAAAGNRSSNAAMLMLPKMIGLMGAVALSVIFLPIDVIAFAVGYSIFIVSIIVESIYSAVRTTPTEHNENSHG